MKLLSWVFKFLTGQQFTLHFGGGGGGGSNQTTSTSYQTNIPEYAQPYTETMLTATQKQLFDMSGNEITGFKPYKPYSTNAADYVAGFSPMQEQAMRTAASPQAFGQEVQGYMSPYMQNVVDIQKREAMRDAGIMSVQRQAQATGAGAFGGYREGLQRAENQRNLMTQMGDIQAKGLQTAYDQGTQQARLAQGQQMQYGQMQQAMEQQKINQAIQDYSNAQQYPLMQLGTMSNMLRGLPMQAQTTNQYAAAPNALTQGIGAVGAGASLINALKGAEGGLPKEFKYAKGGITSVASYDVVGEVMDDLAEMDTQSLKRQAENSPSPRIRAMAKRLLASKAMEMAETNRGAGPTGPMGIDYQAAPVRAARGGILAFQSGGTKQDAEENLSSLQQIERQGISDLAPLAEKYKAAQTGLTAAARSGDRDSVTRYLQEQNTYRTQLDEAAEKRFGNQAPRIISSLLTPETVSQPASSEPQKREAAPRVKPQLQEAGTVSRTPAERAEQARLAAIYEAQRAAPTRTEAAPVRPAAPAPAPAPAGIAQVAPSPARAANAPEVREPVLSQYDAVMKGAKEEADLSVEERARRIKAMAPENTAAAELRREQMAERANLKDEAERQRYMRMAEFFAAWGSTPGPTIAAGLNALQKKLPDMISDKKEFKKAKKELDKAIFDIDNAIRLEELGFTKDARAEKERAAATLMELTKDRLRAETQITTTDMTRKSAEKVAGIQAAATAESARATRDFTKEDRAYKAINVAQDDVREVLKGIDKYKTSDEYSRAMNAIKLYNKQKEEKGESGVSKGVKSQYDAAQEALYGRNGAMTRWNKQLEAAEQDVANAKNRWKNSGGKESGGSSVDNDPFKLR